MRKRETRNTIMQCAINHFQKKGYKEATLEGIAQCAGVSKRTVLRYFRAKEDIAVAFAEDAYDAFSKAAATRPPHARIVDYWRAFMHRVNTRISNGGVLVQHALMVAENPSLYGRRLHIRKRYTDLIARELSREANVPPDNDIYAKMFAILLVHGVNNVVDELVLQGRLDEIVDRALAAIDVAVSNFPKRAKFKRTTPEYAPVDPQIFEMPPRHDPD